MTYMLLLNCALKLVEEIILSSFVCYGMGTVRRSGREADHYLCLLPMSVSAVVSAFILKV